MKTRAVMFLDHWDLLMKMWDKCSRTGIYVFLNKSLLTCIMQGRKDNFFNIPRLSFSWLWFWLLVQSCHFVWSSKGNSWQNLLRTSQQHMQNGIFSFPEIWMWVNLYLCALLSFPKFWSFWIFKSQSQHKTVWPVLAETPRIPPHIHMPPSLHIPAVHTWFPAHLSLTLYDLEQAVWNKSSKNLTLKWKLPGWAVYL